MNTLIPETHNRPLIIEWLFLTFACFSHLWKVLHYANPNDSLRVWGPHAVETFCQRLWILYSCHLLRIYFGKFPSWVGRLPGDPFPQIKERKCLTSAAAFFCFLAKVFWITHDLFLDEGKWKKVIIKWNLVIFVFSCSVDKIFIMLNYSRYVL